MLVAAAGFGIYRFVADKPAKAPANQVVEIKPSVTVTPSVKPTQKAKEKSAYPPGEAIIRLTAIKDCWVGITDNSGKQLYNGTHSSGQVDDVVGETAGKRPDRQSGRGQADRGRQERDAFLGEPGNRGRQPGEHAAGRHHAWRPGRGGGGSGIANANANANANAYAIASDSGQVVPPGGQRARGPWHRARG